ncbi:MAG: 2-phospho-L-lactate transferase [Actinomycetia bacterium]|nr:2-phospho-L-lactate transferase [Actinomycetes bacterium]MCP5034065.1 2-phospho-L-lactate transferase [Actinomycetes bacterium]
MSVVVICGGVGAAKLLVGMIRVVPNDELVAIANVGDDLELHGLHISPDLDTITYTTADAVSGERGWGLEGETWQAMELLSRYGGVDWFGLGDRDLGTHLYRTHRLSQGATLDEVTAEITRTWGLDYQLIPVTNDRLRTMVTTVDEGEISFQEYFVRRHHDVAVTAVRFDGAATSKPAPGVVEAISSADRIVIAPSNPVVSIDPVLAVPGVREAVAARRDDVVAVSPIIGGKALKGPADRLMNELGREASVVGVANWYCDLIGTLVIDEVDGADGPAIEALGVTPVVTATVMSDPATTDALATTCMT